MCPYLAPIVHPPLPHATPLHKGLSGQFSLNGSTDRHRTKNCVVLVYIERKALETWKEWKECYCS